MTSTIESAPALDREPNRSPAHRIVVVLALVGAALQLALLCACGVFVVNTVRGVLAHHVSPVGVPIVLGAFAVVGVIGTLLVTGVVRLIRREAGGSTSLVFGCVLALPELAMLVAASHHGGLAILAFGPLATLVGIALPGTRR